MPTYQYRCADCSEELEKFQHFTDDPLTRCPACGHEALRKVFSPVGIVFKGSGFYATDNRTKGKVNAAAPAHEYASSGEGSASSDSGSGGSGSGGSGSAASGTASAAPAASGSGGASAGKSSGESSSDA